MSRTSTPLLAAHGGPPSDEIERPLRHGSTRRTVQAWRGAARHGSCSRSATMTLHAPPAPRKRPKPPTHVVLAEDDPELRYLLTSALRNSGFEVTEAPDGRAVFDALRHQVELAEAIPDVFVMDVRMPHTTGLDVLRGLRTAGWSQPVVLMTGFGDEDTHARANEEGAAVVLDKPFDVDELVEIVRLVAMRHRAELEA